MSGVCDCRLLQKASRGARLHPSLLRQAFEGSRRPLIVTSSAAILDTGPVPVSENGRLNPPPGFAWLPGFKQEILKSSVRGIVIRPAWEVQGRRPQSSAIPVGWLRLARRFRRGIYIGSGESRYSAVHFDDLADLYCIALKKAHAGTILHATSENFTMNELATATHRGLGYKAEPSSLSRKEARRFRPIADNLTLSHALSGDLARTLGWKPSRNSIMKEIEHDAFVHAYSQGVDPPQTECQEQSAACKMRTP